MNKKFVSCILTCLSVGALALTLFLSVQAIITSTATVATDNLLGFVLTVAAQSLTVIFCTLGCLFLSSAGFVTSMFGYKIALDGKVKMIAKYLRYVHTTLFGIFAVLSVYILVTMN